MKNLRYTQSIYVNYCVTKPQTNLLQTRTLLLHMFKIDTTGVNMIPDSSERIFIYSSDTLCQLIWCEHCTLGGTILEKWWVNKKGKQWVHTDDK